jgi:hypothetical protein
MSQQVTSAVTSARQPFWPIALWSAAVLVVLIVTLDDYAIVWDEGQYLTLEAEMRRWFALLWSGSPSAFSRASVLDHWHFSREQPDGHPPFWAIVGNAGWLLGRVWLPPLAAHRLGSAAIFAIALGGLFRLVQRHWGTLAGATASASLVLMPRVFAHAHLNTTDATLVSLWILSMLAFDSARERWSVVRPGDGLRAWLASALLGVLLGWAAVTKLTGWFVPIPLAAWATLRRDSGGWKALLAAGPACVLAMYVFNPPWWHDPVGGVALFLRENLGRRDNTLITTVFLGKVYAFDLPWYNALVWTAVTVPAGVLALAAVGLVRAIGGRLGDPLAALVVLNWTMMIVLRSLPGVPGHDGERQLMASFPFVACLAAYGIVGVHRFLIRLIRRVAAAPAAHDGLAALHDESHRSYWSYGPRVACGGLIAAALGTALAGVIRYHPVQLAYYNEIIGGPRGAARAGLEPTYFWDALTPDMLEWLNAHSTGDDAVLFSAVPQSFHYLRRWGKLRVRLLPLETGRRRWYVLQNRPGLFRPADRWLIEHGTPSHIRVQDGVPLVWIFTLEQYEQAIRQTQTDQPAGRAAVRE